TKSNRRFRCQKSVPCYAARRQLQLEESARLELGNSHEHAARRAQPEIRARHRFHGTAPGNTAFENLWAHTQRRGFVRADRFEPGSSDRERIDVVTLV